MADDRYARQDEPQRMLGLPIRDPGPRSPSYEPQRVLGFPVGSIGSAPVDRERLLAWAHPLRTYRRWLRRRRLGPYDDEP